MCVCVRGNGLQSGTRPHREVRLCNAHVVQQVAAWLNVLHVYYQTQPSWIRGEKMFVMIFDCLLKRFTKDWPAFKDDLDIMKFLCKDFWSGIFKKQIDNLRTNHQVWDKAWSGAELTRHVWHSVKHCDFCLHAGNVRPTGQQVRTVDPSFLQKASAWRIL